METRRMKKLKEERESSTTTTMENPPEQSQLSEEEKEEIKRENQAMEEILSIPLVVEEIIGCLRLSDLKTCRRACPMWTETATKVILKKDCSQINLGNRRELHKNIDLKQLTDVVKKSTQFPCATISICNVNLRGSELLSFFKVAGRGIKTLILLISNITVKDLCAILKVHCPNLEALKISDARFQWTEDIQFELPKLKVLSVYHDGGGYVDGIEIFRTITAPNLEVVEDFHLEDHTTEVVKAGKVETVKKLKLSNWDYRNPLNLLQAFVSAGPRVEVLTFPPYLNYVDENWKNNFAGTLHQLLDKCKDTFKVFEFSGLGNLFENQKLPRFSKLGEITVVGFEPARIFPIRVNLAETFPNLKIFDVSGLLLGKDVNWDKYFPPPDAYRGQMTSVTTVKVHKSCTQKCQDLIALMCPNATIEYI